MSSYWWLQKHTGESLLRVAAFQGSSSLDGNVESNVAQIELQAARASQEYLANLLVFPEMFLSGYGLSYDVTLSAARYIVQQNVIQRLQNIAKQYSLALLICYPKLVNESMYNSATLINESGEILLTYNKTHLWGNKERELFIEGDQLSSIVEIHGVRVAVMICYDTEIPEVARCLTLLGAQLILVATALATSPANENIARLIVPTRAVENHVWLAYANLAPPDFVGGSQIIGPDGNSLCRVESDSLIVADLIPENFIDAIQSTPYLADRRPLLYSIINDSKFRAILPDDYQYTDN